MVTAYCYYGYLSGYPEKFEIFLTGMQEKEAFEKQVIASFGMNADEMLKRFIETLRKT